MAIKTEKIVEGGFLKTDYRSMLEQVKEQRIDATIPTDVQEVAVLLDGAMVKELLKETLKVNKMDIRAFETKKGVKLFSLFDTGYTLNPQAVLKGYQIDAKVQLVLRKV